MDDRRVLSGIVGIGKPGPPVSGPWRLTAWEPPAGVGGGTIYVFSEEHANEGSCPEHRNFSALASEILIKTRGVHVLVENFVHANDIKVPKMSGHSTPASACSTPVNVGILNSLRNCLEVMKINSRLCPDGCATRIHFIDPRVDMVSVMPDGKLFEAISHFTHHMAASGSFNEAVLTIFEAIVHPLSSLLPDRRNLVGRMVGVFEAFRTRMSPPQRQTFDNIWVGDITGGILDINAKYTKLHETYSSSSNANKNINNFDRDVEELKSSYKRYTNKFMDIWLLAHVFMIQNTPGATGMVMYLGSLHGLQIEKYFARHGLRKIYHKETEGLQSCISLS